MNKIIMRMQIVFGALNLGHRTHNSYTQNILQILIHVKFHCIMNVPPTTIIANTTNVRIATVIFKFLLQIKNNAGFAKVIDVHK